MVNSLEYPIQDIWYHGVRNIESIPSIREYGFRISDAVYGKAVYLYPKGVIEKMEYPAYIPVRVNVNRVFSLDIANPESYFNLIEVSREEAEGYYGPLGWIYGVSEKLQGKGYDAVEIITRNMPGTERAIIKAWGADQLLVFNPKNVIVGK